VSEIPANLQAKLLRVLQEREFERVGGNRTIKVNVRIIATSNRDLLAHVEKGDFRQDLYYRLNVFPVHVPALRERGDDILLLADHFLGRAARRFGIRVAGFSPSARSALMAYRWPGNVRELQNTIERAVILTEAGRTVSASALGLPFDAGMDIPPETGTPFSEEADAADLSATDSPGAAGPAAGSGVMDAHGSVLTIAELEKQAILAALRQTAGNRTKAAEVLGISIRTLRNKLLEYRGVDDLVGTDSE
jgi:DNA-binding NtrC family response regulator